jgi:hypothetical protein
MVQDDSINGKLRIILQSHFQSHFLIMAATNSVRAAGIGAAGKGKKRIFLCARFPPRGEAGDIRIWGGRSPRPPLELIVADFLIAAATNSVRAAGKEKKRIFLCAQFPPRGEAGDGRIWGGGRSPRPPLELVVSGFLIAAATDSCALAVSVH